MSLQLTKEIYESFIKQDVESATKDMAENFLSTNIRHGFKLNLDDSKSVTQAEFDSGSEHESRLIEIFEIGNYTLAIVQIILKKDNQIFGRGEEWVFFHWINNKCISAEIFTDRAVFNLEVTEKWLNSLDIEYEVINLDDSQYRKVF